MANPLILSENILEDASATLSLAGGTPASGFPLTNILDWRMGTAYRYKDTVTTDIHIDLDAGVGNTLTADTFAVAGHNWGTIGLRVSVKADTFTPPTTQRLSNFDPTDDLPLLKTFTEADYRYWRISLFNTPSAALQAGVIVLGRRIDFEAGALFDLDPYHRAVDARGAVSNNGTPIGVDVRGKRKRFQLNYGGTDPGMTRDTFFAPAAGYSFDDDFLPHAIDSAKPFFFNWNYDVDPTEVYLCTVENYEISMPFVGSTARRGLRATLVGYRELT